MGNKDLYAGFEKELKNSFFIAAKDLYETHIPVKAKCPTQGPCFCTGKCQEIIDWIPKSEIPDRLKPLFDL